MAYYLVEPEVAGELGPGSVLDTRVHPPVVSRLEYQFAGWLGDELVESFPCYVVTDRLADEITRAGLTGVALDDVTVTRTPEAQRSVTDRFPVWRWLKVTGTAFDADFGIGEDLRLVVSERALAVLRSTRIEYADIEDAGPPRAGG